jgi:predicted aspartyl protease
MIASLPMTWDRSGGIMVPATLGDRKTTMLVDTGGTFSMVGQHVVDLLKPDTSRIAHGGFTLINNRELKEIAHIRPFALGDMTIHEFLFLVLPDGVVGPKDMDGTIAPDILANFDIEFDFAQKKMNLFSQDHCPGKAVYWARDWAEIPFQSPDNLHIQLDMMLDGKAMRAKIDTGSSSSYLSASVAKEMFGVEAGASTESTPTADMQSDDTSNNDRRFGHRFKSLTANGISIANPQFIVLPDKESKAINHYGQMLLGMPELRRFHLYVAYKEQVLYLTAADAH